jgi:hypothetical protein
MNLNINQLKRQLNIEEDYTNDDAILQHSLDVSIYAVNTYLGNSLSGYTNAEIPITVEQATLILASHYYLNRELVKPVEMKEIPYSFRFLLDPYKNIIVE